MLGIWIPGSRQKLMVVLMLFLSTFFAGVNSQCLTKNDDKAPPSRLDLSQTRRFGVEFLRQIQPRSGNFLFSPFSIWFALTLPYLGSDGSTQKELEKSLYLTNKEDTLAVFKAVQKRYHSVADNKNCTIRSASRMYVDKRLELRQCVRTVLGNAIETANFRQVNDVAAQINKYVEKATEGKISRIISPSELRNTAAVIVNAIYFKGLWEAQFNPQNTRREKFNTSPRRSTYVQMMTQRGDFKKGFVREFDADVLEMPYKGRSVSMIIFLPRAKDSNKGIDLMVDRLYSRSLTAATERMVPDKVEVKFPKFSFDITIKDDLKKALRKMGIKTLFTRNSDLKKFVSSGNLALDKGIHKAAIEVNEEGAEAAAATAMKVTYSLTITKKFHCNKPFFFVIHDSSINNDLFVGIYREPS